MHTGTWAAATYTSTWTATTHIRPTRPTCLIPFTPPVLPPPLPHPHPFPLPLTLHNIHLPFFLSLPARPTCKKPDFADYLEGFCEPLSPTPSPPGRIERGASRPPRPPLLATCAESDITWSCASLSPPPPSRPRRTMRGASRPPCPPLLATCAESEIADYLEGFASQPYEYDYYVDGARIEGQIPRELMGGTLLAAGPGLTRAYGSRVRRPSDGDGMLWSFS
eukprot:19718-Chlamydomonas_euryale.AAC.1